MLLSILTMLSLSLALGGGTSTASTGLFGSAFGATTGTNATSGGMFGTSSGFKLLIVISFLQTVCAKLLFVLLFFK